MSDLSADGNCPHPDGRPIDVLFVMPNLTPGGAQRVAVTLLTYLDPRRVTASLLLVDARNAAWLNEIPSSVPVRSLGRQRVLSGVLPMVRQIRAQAPDVVFSMQWHLNVALAFARPWLPPGIALIGRETSMPSSAIRAERDGRLRASLTRIGYPRLDAIIAQGEAMRGDLAALAPRATDRIRVLPNPLPLERIRRTGIDPKYRQASLEFVAIGRLAKVKGFDRIIDGFSRAALPDARLTIIGEGPLEGQLRMQVESLGLESKVHFAGFIPNPLPWIAAADAMLMGSHHEGFPNSALEAMALGTPVLALPAPGGIAEALSSSPACWIAAAPSADALAMLLIKFDRSGRPRVASDAVDHHEASAVSARLAEIFQETLATRRKGVRCA